MPRYLIERAYGEAEQEAMQNIGQRMKQVAEGEISRGRQLGPQPRRERRVGDEEVLRLRGTERERCASTATMVRDHTILRIYEIAGDVTPADFTG